MPNSRSVKQKEAQLKDGLEGAEGAMGEKTPYLRSIGRIEAQLKM